MVCIINITMGNLFLVPGIADHFAGSPEKVRPPIIAAVLHIICDIYEGRSVANPQHIPCVRDLVQSSGDDDAGDVRQITQVFVCHSDTLAYGNAVFDHANQIVGINFVVVAVMDIVDQ